MSSGYVFDPVEIRAFVAIQVLGLVSALEEGVISGYRATIDRSRVGLGTTVFAEISLTSQQEDHLDEFEAAVLAVPEVLSCHLMAGDADYLIQVVAADVADYERVHRNHMARLPHVAKLRSSFALRRVVERG